MPDIEPTLEDLIAETTPEVQQFISALVKENQKMQKKVAFCQAEKVTLNERIKVLESDDYFFKRFHEYSAQQPNSLDDLYESIITMIDMNIILKNRVQKYLCE